MADLESAKDHSSDFRLELYKSLRAEVAGYVEKIPGLWLQKFILVGAVIAFLVTNHDKLKGSGGLLTASILSIPVLAVLLDAKIVEYGLHARAMSMFIRSSFRDSPVLGEWESALWGEAGGKAIQSMVRLRSVTTVVVTAIPTIVLVILSGLAVDEIRSSHSGAFIYGAVVVSAIYILVTIWACLLVWRTQKDEANPALDSSAAPDANRGLRGRRR
jgi:hypothetical protein